MASLYIPEFVQKHARELYTSFHKEHNAKLSGESNFVCGELASLSSQAEENSFFNSLEAMNKKQDIQDFLFYDIVLVERNLYLPPALCWALFFVMKLGKKRYKNYIQQGAILGLLQKHGYTMVDIQLHFFGIYASVHARKIIDKEIA